MYRRRPVLLPAGPSLGPVAFRSLWAWSTPRGAAAAALQFRSRRRPSGEARGYRLDRRRYRMVNVERTMAARWCGRARTPGQVLVSHRAISSKDCRQHPADCATCVPLGVWWRGQRCQDSGSVCTPASGAVFARDRLGNRLGVVGRRRRPVPCGVVAEFGLWAKRYRYTVVSSSSHRSGPPRRSPWGRFACEAPAPFPAVRLRSTRSGAGSAGRSRPTTSGSCLMISDTECEHSRTHVCARLREPWIVHSCAARS